MLQEEKDAVKEEAPSSTTIDIENDKEIKEEESEETPKKKKPYRYRKEEKEVYFDEEVLIPLKWYQKLTIYTFFGGIMDIIRRMFEFPMVTHEAVHFEEDDRFDPAGNSRVLPIHDDDPTMYPKGQKMSEGTNYERATIEMFEVIARYHEEVKNTRRRVRTDGRVRASHFPDWSYLQLEKYKTLFHFFDANGDSIVDYEEFCAALEFAGDITSKELRRDFFQMADGDLGFLDMGRFLKLCYVITVKNTPKSKTLADALNSIDLNFSKLRDLTLTQKLQSGLY
jgi:hypothetical protein